MVDLILKFALKYIWEIIAVVCIAASIGIVIWKAQTWCNKACRDATEEVIELKNAIKVAEKRATDLALMWSDSLDKTEKKYAEEYKATLGLFRDLDAKGKASASRNPSLRVAPATQRVLNAASAAANAPNPSSPGSSQEGTAALPTTPEGSGNSGEMSVISEADYASSWIEAAKAYASCRLAWSACVASYESVREASGKISTNVQAE